MTLGVTGLSGKQRDLSSLREMDGEGAAEWMEVFREEMPMRVEIRRIPLSMRHDCTNIHNLRFTFHMWVTFICVLHHYSSYIGLYIKSS